MRRPLRNAEANNLHLIAKSKIDVSEIPDPRRMSTSAAIHHYHASKMHKLLHRSKQENNPTIFYKVGDHLKTKTTVQIEGSPMPKKLRDVQGQSKVNEIAKEVAA